MTKLQYFVIKDENILNKICNIVQESFVVSKIYYLPTSCENTFISRQFLDQ